MALNAWRTIIIGALAVAGVALLGASCGGSGTTASGCIRGGSKCPLGCQENLGCVSCLANADCGTANGAPICVLGQCEECGVTADCGAGRACFPGDHSCRPACLTNADCVPDAPE